MIKDKVKNIMVEKQFSDEQAKVLKVIADNPIFKNFVSIPINEIHTPKSLHMIVGKILDFYEISGEEFFSKRRGTTLNNARKDFCHLAKQHTEHSNVVIGRCFNRDNSTVIHYLGNKPHKADVIL